MERIREMRRGGITVKSTIAVVSIVVAVAVSFGVHERSQIRYFTSGALPSVAVDPYAEAAKVWESDYVKARQVLYDEAICVKNHKGVRDPCLVYGRKYDTLFIHLNSNYPYPTEGKNWGDRETRMENLALCNFNIADSIYFYGFNPPIGDNPAVEIDNCLKYGHR
jgi:hypothetical protein